MAVVMLWDMFYDEGKRRSCVLRLQDYLQLHTVAVVAVYLLWCIHGVGVSLCRECWRDEGLFLMLYFIRFIRSNVTMRCSAEVVMLECAKRVYFN